MIKHREDVSGMETYMGKALVPLAGSSSTAVFSILSNALMCTNLTMLILF